MSVKTHLPWRIEFARHLLQVGEPAVSTWLGYTDKTHRPGFQIPQVRVGGLPFSCGDAVRVRVLQSSD